jgi:hypothetical protein
MSIYSITYLSTTEQEEAPKLGFSIPVDNKCSIEEIKNEIWEILQEYFPSFKVLPEEILYATYSAYPSWIGLDEEETMFLNFGLS